MNSADPWPEEAGYPCAWDPVACDVVVVLYPVVEEPEDVAAVVVPGEDGEPVVVPFCSFHQCFVFIADGYSYRCSWNSKQFVF